MTPDERPTDERSRASAEHGLGATYQLLAKLSEGGMGAIYKARHRHLDQVRVIKVMRPQLEDQSGFQARFLREAQLAASATHPHIAQLHEYAVTPGGLAYMVMEFIDGLTLEQVLKSSGPATAALGLQVAEQALSALGYLHQLGSIHRDVSPDNLMLTRGPRGELRLKLIDLGIAKKVEEPDDLQITRTGTFVGKVRYASPEQFNTLGELDYRSDLYSLGVVLYELLTGHYPIQGKDTSSLIAGHLFHPFMDFAESDPAGRVPERLRAALARALAKKPDERYPTAEDFAAELSALPMPRELQKGELEGIFRRGRKAYPQQPEHSTEVGEGDLWRLLDKDSPTADPTAATAVTTPEHRPRQRPRAWMLAAAGLLLAAIVVFALLQTAAPPASREGGVQTELSQERAPITEPLKLGRYYALVIGNDDYAGGLEPLTTAVAGAQAVADVLESDYGFEVRRLVNATYTEVRAGIEAYASLKPEDNLLIFYAGHGRLEGQTGYWLPVDAERENTANWISNRDISETLLDLPAQHVLVVADSCYSGALADGEHSGPPPAPTEAARAAYIQRMKEQVARLALTSGGEVPVLDRGSGTHSVFTNALLNVLSGNSDVLETALLYTRLRDRVSDAVARLAVELEPGYAQAPEYAPIPSAGDAGGEFFFAPSRLQAL